MRGLHDRTSCASSATACSRRRLAAAALQLLERHPEIRLLFTDVGLPGGMNGRQLADAARTLRPELKVLFTTGYARNAIVHDGRLDPGVAAHHQAVHLCRARRQARAISRCAEASARILVVEDEVLIRMVAVDELEALGFRSRTPGRRPRP